MDIDDIPVVLDIHDTAGTDEFAMIRDSHIREGDGFIIVYAINDRSTFHEVQNLYDHVCRVKGEREVTAVLVGKFLESLGNS